MSDGPICVPYGRNGYVGPKNGTVFFDVPLSVLVFFPLAPDHFLKPTFRIFPVVRMRDIQIFQSEQLVFRISKIVDEAFVEHRKISIEVGNRKTDIHQVEYRVQFRLVLAEFFTAYRQVDFALFALGDVDELHNDVLEYIVMVDNPIRSEFEPVFPFFSRRDALRTRK